MMRCHVSQSRLWGVVCLGLLGAMGVAQPVAKPAAIRTGVKTTEPRVVAHVEGTTRLDELEEQAEQTFTKLAADATQAGLALIPQFILEMDLPQGMDGGAIVAWEARIPILNEAPADNTEVGGVKVKALAPLNVAYTFHQGPLNAVDFTIQTLVAWMMQNGHVPGNKILFVSRTSPDNTKAAEMIVEVQIPPAT